MAFSGIWRRRQISDDSVSIGSTPRRLVDPGTVELDMVQSNFMAFCDPKLLLVQSQDAQIICEAEVALVDLYMMVRAKTEDILRHIRAAVRTTERPEVCCLSVHP